MDPEGNLLLGISSENTFPQQYIHTKQYRNCSKQRFLYSLCQGYIMRFNGPNKVRKNMVTGTAGTETENDCAGKDQ